MRDLKQLPDIANRSLAGLTADQKLKYRILQASREHTPKHRARVPAWVPALCCALVLAVGVITAVPSLLGQSPSTTNDAGVVLHSQRQAMPRTLPVHGRIFPRDLFSCQAQLARPAIVASGAAQTAEAFR